MLLCFVEVEGAFINEGVCIESNTVCPPASAVAEALYGPEFHRLVLAGADERVLTVQARQAPDTVGVAWNWSVVLIYCGLIANPKLRSSRDSLEVWTCDTQKEKKLEKQVCFIIKEFEASTPTIWYLTYYLLSICLKLVIYLLNE